MPAAEEGGSVTSDEVQAANMATLRRWIEEGWNQRDLSLVEELFHEEIVTEGRVRADGVEMVGRQAVVDFLEKMVHAIPDIQIEILNLTAAGDLVVAEYRITGTHQNPYREGAPAPGDAVEFFVTEVARFVDGQIFHRRDVIGDSRNVRSRFGV